MRPGKTDSAIENGMRLCKPADMHCHLDFAEGAMQIAAEAAADGRRLLSMTVDPRDFERVRRMLSPSPNVDVAAGLHPWWVADGRCGDSETELLASLAARTRFVGEVGLDFAKRHAGTEEAQVRAFEHVMSACAREGGKVVSIHALRAGDAVLDVLERTGACESCACILHWFSGSSGQLQRAMRLGCWFSLNDRMMATGRGREYAKAMPLSRMLLETDLPSRAGEACTYARMSASLDACLSAVERARGMQCGAAILENSLRLLDGRPGHTDR